MNATTVVTIDTLLADWLAAIDGTFTVSEESEKFLAAMEESHADELTAWLNALARSVIRDRMQRKLNLWTEEEWAAIWLTAERQGIGASRSQGMGTFTVTKWETL